MYWIGDLNRRSERHERAQGHRDQVPPIRLLAAGNFGLDGWQD